MPQGEQEFRRWYAEQAKRYDMDPNPDSPQQFYDWRAAFKAGAQPDKSLHWPSDFKKPGHPNEIVGGFNTRTGERVPGMPRAKSVEELVSKGWDRDTAIQLMAMPEPSSPQVDFDALAKQYGGSAAASPEPPPVQAAPQRMFSTEPKMLQDVEAGRQANSQAVGQLMADHPLITAGVAATIAAGPAILRSGAGAGASLAARVAQITKSATSMVVAPQIKYEIVRRGLTALGMPEAAAVPIAIAASGYQRGAKPAPAAPPATPTPAPVAAAPAPMAARPPVPAGPSQIPARVVGAEPTPSAAPVPPPASAPAAQTASAATPPPPTAATTQTPNAVPQWSPARLANEVALSARRMKVQLTPDQDQMAQAMVRQGVSPMGAVAKVGGTPLPAAPAPMQAPAPELSADELEAVARLIRSGKTPQEAMAALGQQKALAQTLGTPTPSEVNKRVSRRLAKTNRTSEEQ